MKKLILVLILIMAVMLIAKDKDLQEAISSSPQEVFDVIKGKYDQFVDYKPERFQELLSRHNLELDRRGERYINNISRTQADLLTFMNKYCDGDKDNLNLDKQTVQIVCKVAEQALYGN